MIIFTKFHEDRTKIVAPLFFISKKVQVETPELEPGGNACNFTKIMNYCKLEIGLWRDLRDFAIFLIYFRFFQGSNPGPSDPKANALKVRLRGQGEGRQKKFKIQ